ncbi:cytochrome b/b6 domain-containing protein [Sphingomonas sp. SM33]|uniref:Cytochrome b/b6 domain-containing protein n=1 Tax=Sphingomonas telluris TaxID=2907998 RepID=A0ABS9VI50_9SPHN|nr:cytochrome b/b6 domain-containing protein [Sphingomonas telluris]MCH8614654.1 cytochrome b/b6 domain-containing protein [Sphingomonas telluris]
MSSVPETAPQEAVLRYSNTTVTLHWVTVLLVLFQAYLGFRFGLSEPGPGRDNVFVWHKSVGVVILLLTLGRLAYRLKNPPPPFPPELPAWERFAAVWNHRLFYLLLIAMPIVGFISVSGFADGPTTPLIGGIQVPVIPGISKETGEMAGDVHAMSAFLLIALILLHVGAALKHQFVDRWRGSARMPPFTSHGAPVAIGQGGDRDPVEG